MVWTKSRIFLTKTRTEFPWKVALGWNNIGYKYMKSSRGDNYYDIGHQLIHEWSKKYHSSVLVRSMVPYKKTKGKTEAGNHLRRRVRRHGIFAFENVECHAKHFMTLWAGIGYHWFSIVDILYVENIGKTSLKTHAHEEKNDSNCSLVCTNESNSYLLWFFDRWQ